MALLERVSTLIRANLNDLVDKAEDPEKMIKHRPDAISRHGMVL